MARPNWEYIRVDVRMPRHPKLDGLTDATKWKLVELWCACGEDLTDGFVRTSAWRKIVTPRQGAAIIAAGFAEPVDGGYQMHDYLGHQRSRAQVAERKAIGSTAGKASARQRDVQRHAQHEPNVTFNGNSTEAEAEAEADHPVADVSNRSNGSKPRTGEPIIDIVRAEILGVTGKTVTDEWAAKIASHILEGRRPADPRAYIRQAIRNEPNPRNRFLPVY